MIDELKVSPKNTSNGSRWSIAEQKEVFGVALVRITSSQSRSEWSSPKLTYLFILIGIITCDVQKAVHEICSMLTTYVFLAPTRQAMENDLRRWKARLQHQYGPVWTSRRPSIWIRDRRWIVRWTWTYLYRKRTSFIPGGLYNEWRTAQRNAN